MRDTRTLLLIVACFVLGMVASVSADFPQSSNATFQFGVEAHWARALSLVSQPGEPMQVVLFPPSGYALRLHVIQAYCAIATPLTILDGTTSAYSKTLPAGTNFTDAWGYPGAAAANGSYTVQMGACGSGNRGYLHLMFSP